MRNSLVLVSSVLTIDLLRFLVGTISAERVSGITCGRSKKILSNIKVVVRVPAWLNARAKEIVPWVEA